MNTDGPVPTGEEVYHGKYATIVLLDVPVGTVIALDTREWQAGPNFRGVKMVSPGLHLLSTSASGGHRSGCFLLLRPGDIAVRRWDTNAEVIAQPDAVSEEEQERFRQGVRSYSLDPFLGAHDPASASEWIPLTSKWTLRFVESLNIRIGETVELSHGALEGAEREMLDAQAAAFAELDIREGEAPASSSSSALHLRHPVLPHIDLQWRQSGAKGADITSHNTDRSELVRELLCRLSERMGVSPNSPEADAALIALQQTAFVLMVYGLSLDGVECWKRIVTLMCGCDRIVRERRSLFVGFIDALCDQLQACPKDLFINELSRENFLLDALQEHFERMDESQEEENDELRKRSERLRKLLRKRFQWDIDAILRTRSIEYDADDEYAPTIVYDVS